MKQIGVREIRQHASEYLRQVEGGETLCVTSRGQPVAVVLPFGEALAEALHGMLQDLVDEGIFPSTSSAIDAGSTELASRVRDALLDRTIVDGYRRAPEDADHWLDEAALDTLGSTEWK